MGTLGLNIICLFTLSNLFKLSVLLSSSMAGCHGGILPTSDLVSLFCCFCLCESYSILPLLLLTGGVGGAFFRIVLFFSTFGKLNHDFLLSFFRLVILSSSDSVVSAAFCANLSLSFLDLVEKDCQWTRTDFPRNLCLVPQWLLCTPEGCRFSLLPIKFPQAGSSLADFV